MSQSHSGSPAFAQGKLRDIAGRLLATAADTFKLLGRGRAEG